MIDYIKLAEKIFEEDFDDFETDEDYDTAAKKVCEMIEAEHGVKMNFKWVEDYPMSRMVFSIVK